MRIIVFGITGMLGRYVYRYFSQRHYDVIGFSRAELDISKVNWSAVSSLGILEDDIIINCAGLIKQRENVDTCDFIAVNSIFPLLLSSLSRIIGCKLIHITTDCVFSGKDGAYTETSAHDATDIYGMSKSIGEPKDATIVRTSIIGEEQSGFLSLLEWVKANAGKEVRGYTDHFWNGITCLQFAEVCEHIIDNNLFWRGVKHVFSPESINKCDLVRLISKVYGLNIYVIGHETGTKCDRSLDTIREDVSIEVPDLEYQLTIMRQFGEN